MRVRCNSCLGVYDTIQRDGSGYSHACAPLSVVELRALLAAGGTPLTKAQLTELATRDAIAAPLQPSAAYVAPGDAYLQTLAIERPYKRDENIDLAKWRQYADRDGRVADTVARELVMVAPGLGVTSLEDMAVDAV